MRSAASPPGTLPASSPADTAPAGGTRARYRASAVRIWSCCSGIWTASSGRFVVGGVLLAVGGRQGAVDARPVGVGGNRPPGQSGEYHRQGEPGVLDRLRVRLQPSGPGHHSRQCSRPAGRGNTSFLPPPLRRPDRQVVVVPSQHLDVVRSPAGSAPASPGSRSRTLPRGPRVSRNGWRDFPSGSGSCSGPNASRTGSYRSRDATSRPDPGQSAERREPTVQMPQGPPVLVL